MPPPNAVPTGPPYTLPPWVTTGKNAGSTFAIAGSPVRSTSVWDGLSACRSEPELYQKTSCMSPVDSLVFTRLSPWVPGGRVSVLTVTPGFAFWKASTTSCADLTTSAALPMSSVSVPPPLPPPAALLDEFAPPSPELHAVIVTRAAAAAPAVASLRPAIFIGEPPGVRAGDPDLRRFTDPGCGRA